MEIKKYYSLLILITPFTAIGGLISKTVDLLIWILLLLSFFNNFDSLNFRITKGSKIVIYLCLIIIFLLIIQSILITPISYGPLLGMIIRLLIILLATQSKLDLENINNTFKNGIIIALICSIFSDRYRFFKVFSLVANANQIATIACSFLFLFLLTSPNIKLKSNFTLYISFLLILIINFSRQVVVSLLLISLIYWLYKFFYKVITKNKISKKSIITILSIPLIASTILSLSYFVSLNKEYSSQRISTLTQLKTNTGGLINSCSSSMTEV